MLNQKMKLAARIMAAAGFVVSTIGTASAVTINGVGSTFVNPAMAKWAQTYHAEHADTSINYQSVGSGAGIAQYKAGTVDFGASDAALTNDQMRSLPQPSVILPVVAGAVVMAYHINGVGPGLHLSGDVISQIYQGTITAWNDSRIQKENPHITLPAEPITVAHRSDGSGTTNIFTTYLSAVSSDWRLKVGLGTTVNWPTGLGGPGNAGVSGIVRNTPGGIGYVELAYAITNHLNYAQVKNRAGSYVSASIASTTAAAEASASILARDVRTPWVNAVGVNSYPITGFTFVMLPKLARDPAKGGEMKSFFEWAIGPGQQLAETLYYAPLPGPVAQIDRTILASVR